MAELKYLARGVAALGLAIAIVAQIGPAFAQESAPPPAPVATPAPTPKPTKKKHELSVSETGIEPASGKLKIKEDAWAYERASTSSKHVKRVHKGKYVVVTGAIGSYVRVQLKDGKTAYVKMSALELATTTDKTYTLTSNSSVYELPARSSKRVAEVHKGYQVHVIGMSLEYAKIRMKSGLEGYVPVSALE